MSEFLTAKEAAEFLGVSKSMIRKLIKTRKLAGEKDEKGFWVIPRESVNDFLKDGKAPVEKTGESKPSRFIMNDYV